MPIPYPSYVSVDIDESLLNKQVEVTTVRASQATHYNMFQVSQDLGLLEGHNYDILFSVTIRYFLLNNSLDKFT